MILVLLVVVVLLGLLLLGWLVVVVVSANLNFVLGVLAELVVFDLFLFAVVFFSFIVILSISLLFHIFLKLLTTRDKLLVSIRWDWLSTLGARLLTTQPTAVTLRKVPLIFSKLSLNLFHVDILPARGINDLLDTLFGDFVQICEVTLVCVRCFSDILSSDRTVLLLWSNTLSSSFSHHLIQAPFCTAQSILRVEVHPFVTLTAGKRLPSGNVARVLRLSVQVVPVRDGDASLGLVALRAL